MKTISMMKPRLTQVTIQFNSCYCGLPLSAIKLPEHCLCLGIIRKDELILASSEPTINCGDDILALAIKGGNAPELEFILRKHHPISWSGISCDLAKEHYSDEHELFRW